MRRAGIALVLGAIMLLCVSDLASASHSRPQSGTPTTFKLVTAFAACTTANAGHGAPLSVNSCDPPVQRSSYLTWAAPDRPVPFAGPTNGKGSVTLKMTCLSSINPPVTNGDTAPCSANAGDQMDVLHNQAIADVRCIGASGQGNCAGGAGSVYNGKLMATARIQITDHFNTRSGQPCSPNCTATAQALTFSVGSQCVSGTCNIVSSWDSVLPGTIPEGKRSSIEILEFYVDDAGLNGNLNAGAGGCPPACSQDDISGMFLRQGIFGP